LLWDNRWGFRPNDRGWNEGTLPSWPFRSADRSSRVAFGPLNHSSRHESFAERANDVLGSGSNLKILIGNQILQPFTERLPGARVLEFLIWVIHECRFGSGCLVLVFGPVRSEFLVRVENHPLPGSNGQPVKHGNVETWDPQGNTVQNTRVVPPVEAATEDSECQSIR